MFEHCGWRLRALAFTLTIGAALLAEASARSQDAPSYSTLYSFTGGMDGSSPNAGVIRDKAGNLYGTTVSGGIGVDCGGFGCGVVFKVSPAGKETVLYSFTGPSSGENPAAGLLASDGNLYGTTLTFGGNVFKFDVATGQETVLYTFTGGADGLDPRAALITDGAGNFYSTTAAGGDLSGCARSGCGVVFRVDETGSEVALYSFTGGADGSVPYGGLVRDAAGNLYGTTSAGGASHAGVVFMLDPTGKETVLYNFTGAADGKTPLAGLVRDAAGNLYGTTSAGGASGFGVAFKVDPTGTETVLHSFAGGTSDGKAPSAGLVRDAGGNLFGVTPRGGASNLGVVFKLDPAGKETVLHSFSGNERGVPQAGLLLSHGNLYGTTADFGGTVFKLAP